MKRRRRRLRSCLHPPESSGGKRKEASVVFEVFSPFPVSNLKSQPLTQTCRLALWVRPWRQTDHCVLVCHPRLNGPDGRPRKEGKLQITVRWTQLQNKQGAECLQAELPHQWLWVNHSHRLTVSHVQESCTPKLSLTFKNYQDLNLDLEK